MFAQPTLSITLNKLIRKITQLSLGLGMIMLSFFVLSGQAKAAACTQATGLGTLTKTGISVPKAGSYKVWVRMQAGSALGNAVGVEVTPSGGSPSCVIAGGTGLSSVGWEWKQAGSITATATGNTLKLVGSVADVKVDRVILIDSTSTCVPSNVRNTTSTTPTEPGDNCIVASPTATPTAVVVTPTLPATPSRTPSPTPTRTPTPVPTKTPVPTATPTPVPPLGSLSKPSLTMAFDWAKGRYYIWVNWKVPTGSSSTTKYDVIRGTQLIGTSTTAGFADYNLAANTDYTYQVQARNGTTTTTSPTVTGRTLCFFIFCTVQEQ